MIQNKTFICVVKIVGCFLGVGNMVGMEAKKLMQDEHHNVLYHCVKTRAAGAAPSRQCILSCYRLPEMRALLDTIAYAEGTFGVGKNLHDEYAAVVFGNQLSDFTDHPRVVYTAQRRGQTMRSSAAGRYQLLGKIWDGIADKLSLSAFGPREQDYAALFLIAYNKHNITALLHHDIEAIIYRLHRIWPSLPGKDRDIYGQTRTNIHDIKQFYTQAVYRHKGQI